MNATRTRIAAVVRGMRKLIRLHQNRIERLERELRASQSHANGLQLTLDSIANGRSMILRETDRITLCIDVNGDEYRRSPRILEIAISRLRDDAMKKLNQR